MHLHMYLYTCIIMDIFTYTCMCKYICICIQIQGGANNKIRVNSVVLDVLQERKMRAAYVLSQVLSIYMYLGSLYSHVPRFYLFTCTYVFIYIHMYIDTCCRSRRGALFHRQTSVMQHLSSIIC